MAGVVRAPVPPGGQSGPWLNGYAWAYGEGQHGKLGCMSASDAYGYEFVSPAWHEFMRGAEYAQSLQDEAYGE